jgi:hypothetical protein
MSGYTKLFSSIVGSTIWREPNHVRIVWVTMLALADRRGIVEASVPGLAGFARVSRRQCDEALERLQAPDPDSRSPAEEGRRIRPVAGGWQLVNFSTYREKMGADERREYKRLKQQERRRRGKGGRVDTSVDSRGQLWTHVDAVDTVPAPEAEAEATPGEREPRAREGYAFAGQRLVLTARQHAHLARMCGGVEVDLVGEAYPRWDAELVASGEPFQVLDWCEARLKAELGIRRPATPSEADYAEAERIYRHVTRGCQHEPTCADREACVGKTALRVMLHRIEPRAVRA